MLPIVSSGAESAETGIPFKYAAGHILVIPVKVCGKSSEFILDTGCGVNVLSQALVEKLAKKKLGKYSGKRMSGQELRMSMAQLPELQVGSCTRRDIPVASWKLEDLFAGAEDLAKVEGIVSLNYFEKVPFTFDYQKKMIYLEDASTLRQRENSGFSVPIKVKSKRGFEASITLPISFSDGSHAQVEVDTGSGSLILDERYMKIFGIDKSSDAVKTVKGKDETAHSYIRYFTKLPVDLALPVADGIRQETPAVEFQRIIYDGLIGDAFLRNFIVTYDLPNKRMIFNRPR